MLDPRFDDLVLAPRHLSGFSRRPRGLAGDAAGADGPELRMQLDELSEGRAGHSGLAVTVALGTAACTAVMNALSRSGSTNRVTNLPSITVYSSAAIRTVNGSWSEGVWMVTKGMGMLLSEACGEKA